MSDPFLLDWGEAFGDSVLREAGVLYLAHNHDLSPSTRDLSLRYSDARARYLRRLLPDSYQEIFVAYDDRGQDLEDFERERIRSAVTSASVLFFTEKDRWPSA